MPRLHKERRNLQAFLQSYNGEGDQGGEEEGHEAVIVQ
jgi:hypothetical protein